MKLQITNKHKKIIILTTIILFALLAVVGIILGLLDRKNASAVSEKWISEPYVYENKLPSTEETEEWINIDGQLKETEWQDNQWLTYSSYGVEFGVTTEFTQKGIYIAGKAIDPFVYYDGDYEFKDSTNFTINLIREDEKAVDPDVNIGLRRPGRILQLMVDARNITSLTNVPVTSGVAVQGTLNTTQTIERNKTEGWSFELFISWKALKIEDKYFAEDGIPNNMKMYVSYNRIDGENENKLNVEIIPRNTQHFVFDSYWLFGRQGLTGNYSSMVLNNAQNGPAATDHLKYTKGSDGELVITSEVPRTQFTWAQGPASENFLIEATFTLGEFSDLGNFGVGFITHDSINASGGYRIYAAMADELKHSDTLIVSNSNYTDSRQWISNNIMYKTVEKNYQSPYGEDTVKLKLIKIGGYMYYFVNNKFIESEYNDNHKGAVNVGLFFNVLASATGYRYEDYTDNVQELMSEVGEYVYFINVPGVTAYGSVTSEKAVVTKGDPITIDVSAGSGYLFKEIFNNGTSIFKDIKNGAYTFTPTEDVNIKAEYYKMNPNTESSKLDLKITDEKNESLSGVSYTIKDTKGQIVYKGKDNGRGKIMVSVPRKGTISTGVHSLTFDGNYSITIEKEGYIGATYQIKVGKSEKIEKTYKISGFQYGSVVVNGKSTSDVRGVFDYSSEKGMYYSPAKSTSGREIAYHRDYIGKEYAFKVTINSEPATGAPNVPGVVVTNGGGQTIILKVSAFEPNLLFISNGAQEVSITGFTHTHTKAGGTAVYTVVRRGDVIYVFDCNDELGVILTSSGVQVMGKHTFKNSVNLDRVNASVITFFKKSGQDNAVGIYSDYNDGSPNTYFDVKWSNDRTQINKALASISYIPLKFPTNGRVTSVKYMGAYDKERGFIEGATGCVYLKNTAVSPVVSQIIIKHADGTDKKVSANYNGITGESEFSFTLTEPCTGVEYKYGNTYTVSGKISGITDAKSIRVVFFDTDTGEEFSAYTDSSGNYNIRLFASTYNMLATKDKQAEYKENVVINKNTKLNLILKSYKYYIGSTTVNGIGISSSSVVGLSTIYDSLDGKVTIPANNASLLGILGNQVYTGKDSFKYTIKVSEDGISCSDGTSAVATQLGFGFTDGTNWWVIFVKNGENNGKSIGIGVNQSGMGGGDFVYKTDLSPNSILVDSGTGALSADVVLTLEKTASAVTLYAGEGDSRVKIFTATPSGYQFADANGTISNQKTMEGQYSKLGGFFDPKKEFALCLGSFYYNADVTFQIDVQ